MAFVRLKDCTADGDLAQAILDVEQNLGDIKQALDQAVQAIVVDSASLAAGNLILTQETTQCPNPLGDYTAAAGLPALDYSVQADEERLELVGIIMIDGILYLAGNDGNIDNFRRLYFALGADTARFIATVNSGAAIVVVQTYLQVQKLPALALGVLWTVEQAQTQFKNPAIEAVYTAGDGNTYCVVPTFMAVNQSAQQVAQDNNIPINQISTQVFWFNQVLTNASIINNLNNLGVTGDQQTSILANQRLISVRPSVETDAETQFALQTQKALDQINLLNPRFTTLDQPGLQSFWTDITNSATAANQIAYQLQGIVRFSPTLIVDPTQIATFLQKNTQADLDYLFSTRRSVSSINFAATSDQIQQTVRQTLSIQAGSTTLSAIQANQEPVTIDPDIDHANNALVQNICGLNSLAITPFQYLNLQVAYGCLTSSLAGEPAQTSQVTPITGYQSYDSPATVLFRQSDIYITLGLDQAIANLENLAAALALPIQIVVQALAALIKATSQIINNFFNQIRQQINQYTQQLESFMSRYMALHGNATVNAGILRCSFGYALTPQLPILQTILDYINSIETQIRNLIAQLTALLSKFLNELLCYPVNLANGFLGGLESNLPSFCQAYKVTLPTNINAALLQIQNIFIFQQDMVRGNNRDLFRLSATVQAAPDKIAAFKQSLICDSQSNNNFFNSAKSALGVGFSIPNPLSSVPKIGL